MSKKIIVISVVAVVALLGVGVWWLFNSGRLVYVAPGSQAPVSVAVCGSDTVSKYNDAAFLIKREGADTPSMDKDGLKALATDIKGKKDYANDPTCQTLLFWTAVHTDDYKSALAAYQAVKDLHAKRAFADSNIRGNEALDNYELYLNSLTGAENSKEEIWSE